jgi:hypothetical protein
LMDIDFGKVARSLESPAYVAVGFGVLGFQRAQVRRREVQRQVARLATTVSQMVGEASNDVAERLPREVKDLVTAATDLSQDLPREANEAAREVMALGRLMLKAPRGSASRRPVT